ncbi:relaxase/mobilization nuclease domain-containing protein [Catenuloplanes sp. NPDC051500]|uniref:relaxase/mobilization nuclease domain-containing protein n=1 Tax=Catenuloplanes sp. NPDC051500 TaxID=3363959 RepID=UPI0037BA856A
MIPNIRRGRRVGGLLRYLYGPGRREEHVNPHLVAAWDGAGPLSALEPAAGHLGKWDFRALADVLEQPVRSGRNPPRQAVWHCSLRTHPSDRRLSDVQWGRIAAEVMAQAGLAPHGDEGAVRWVAVRHGADHIHIVVTLVRQDRRTEWARHDRWRVQAACRDLEERYGLHRVGRAATARRRPTAPELHKARRLQRSEADRDVLRRETRFAAAAANGAEEFFALLREDGLLVRPRMSSTRPGEVTGYSVAIDRPDPIWYGGGRLATDLTLPRLRARWQETTAAPSTGEQDDLIDRAIREVRAAGLEGGDACDLLFVAARHVPGKAKRRILLRAADALDRAARPRRSAPARTRADLRVLARLLHLTGQLGDDRNTAAVLELLLAFARLAEALADLKAAGRQLHQARDAREAARLLRTAAGPLSPGVTQPLTPGRDRRQDPAAADAPGRHP